MRTLYTPLYVHGGSSTCAFLGGMIRSTHPSESTPLYTEQCHPCVRLCIPPLSQSARLNRGHAGPASFSLCKLEIQDLRSSVPKATCTGLLTSDQSEVVEHHRLCNSWAGGAASPSARHCCKLNQQLCICAVAMADWLLTYPRVVLFWPDAVMIAEAETSQVYSLDDSIQGSKGMQHDKVEGRKKQRYQETQNLFLVSVHLAGLTRAM